jgi:very-short-patch-repair endonuclease
MGKNIMTDAARELRMRQTEAERILWSRLKGKQFEGVKFRRQEPIGNYIVDIISYEKKLILEIDGNPHREKMSKLSDHQRTLWLQSQGFRVLRFWNYEVLNDIERVLKKINKYI